MIMNTSQILSVKEVRDIVCQLKTITLEDGSTKKVFEKFSDLKGYKLVMKQGNQEVTYFVPIDSTNSHYQLIQQWIKEGNTPEPAYTDEEILQEVRNRKIEELKRIRQQKVDNIVVTLDSGEVLDGDEISQDRMNRAVAGLPDDKTELPWIDHNNNLIKLTKPKFLDALQKAGQAMTEIYVTYQKLRDKVNSARTPEDVVVIEWE